MLAENAFLRRLPNITDPVSLILVEAIVFSADSVSISDAALRQEALKYREKIVDAKWSVHVGMFLHAWNIVDCIHVIRQMLEALDYGTTLGNEFRQTYDVARRLRNKMDHLRGNVSNVALAKARPPVFGVLGYCLIADNVSHYAGGIVSICAGRFSGGGKITLVNPAGLLFENGIGGLTLQAFGEEIRLDTAVKNLKALVEEMNEKIEQDLCKFSAGVAKERNIPVERVLAHDLSGLAMFLPFIADDQVPGASIS